MTDANRSHEGPSFEAVFAPADAGIISHARIILMGALNYTGRDGSTFRELQSFGMSDGKLLSNLYALRDSGYIVQSSVKVENKTLKCYTITPEGEAAWQRTTGWLMGACA